VEPIVVGRTACLFAWKSTRSHHTFPNRPCNLGALVGRHSKTRRFGGPKRPRFVELAIELNATEGASRTAVHRLQARFADELQAEIAVTLDDPSPVAIGDESRDLFAALGN
jgi:hypothetical protein